MKRTAVVFIAVLLTVSLSLLAGAMPGSGVRAQPSVHRSAQVVIFTCIPLGRLQDGLSVERSSSSAGAPAVRTRLNCAQALADLLDEGYNIADVEFFAGDQVLYTMVRQ